MAYQARRDGHINQNEIDEYIYFPNGCKALDGAKEFHGTVEQFEDYLAETGKEYYGKIHDGNKVVFNKQRNHKNTDDNKAVDHALSLTMDFFS